MDRVKEDKELIKLIKHGCIEEVERRYVESVEELDRQIGQVDDHLIKTGIKEKTALVLCSDHSEHWGESPREIVELDFHKGSRGREVSRVALIMRGEGLPAGKRITPQVRLIDVFPTLVKMLNLKGVNPHGHFWITGRSLFPVIKGEETENRFAPVSILTGVPEGITTEQRLSDLGYA